MFTSHLPIAASHRIGALPFSFNGLILSNGSVLSDKIGCMNLEQVQAALREQKLDGWLFYDHHNRDPLGLRILGMPADGHVTRRWYYFVPAAGEPRKLVHRIESGRLDSLPGVKDQYSSWQELEAKLAGMLVGATRVAMQYSPRNAIMYVSMVDAGTVEVLRGFGKEIVSSADLVSQFEAVLTEAQIATHYEAQRRLDGVLEAGWKEMGRRVRAGEAGAGKDGADEFSMVEFLQAAIEREGMVTEHGPNVSVGPNSADSHYEPSRASSRAIRRGDFVLIDIWAKLEGRPEAVWYDITWTGVVDREPTERELLVFNTVREARDASIAVVRAAFAAGTPIAGWQADDAARGVIAAAGFGDYFTHRTGHNIATELHGSGAHLDNLETHDERLILPDTCFSVEPGLYFPGEFGVRNEVNMITRMGKAEVTGRMQTELVRI
jgi:Xaa-Pro dipeptidase